MKTNIQIWAIAKLVPYAGTLRRNDDAIDRMVAAFNEFKLMHPLPVRGDGEIVDGHLRLKADQQAETMPISQYTSSTIRDLAARSPEMGVPHANSDSAAGDNRRPPLFACIVAFRKNCRPVRVMRYLSSRIEPWPLERLDQPCASDLHPVLVPVERRHEKWEIADFADGGVK